MPRYGVPLCRKGRESEGKAELFARLSGDERDQIEREVERLLGRKPMIFTDLDQILCRSDILAVDVVTDGSMHHQVTAPALQAGKHALVEKPLGSAMASPWCCAWRERN